MGFEDLFFYGNANFKFLNKSPVKGWAGSGNLLKRLLRAWMSSVVLTMFASEMSGRVT